MKTRTFSTCGLLLGVWAAALPGLAQPKLLIQDSPADTGAEPDIATDPMVNPGGEMWVSQDIWVTQAPMAGYTPYPFTTASPPMWMTLNPHPNQSPQYRDPHLSQPNFVYVRISNVGTAPSLGTEQLHVYWAKASTGLSWPGQWVDYLANYCGPNQLYGMEITKPRRNIADPTVPLSEVQNYLSAINSLAQNPGLQFSDGVQYWYKQNAEHYFVATKYVNGPTLPPGPPTYGAPAFSAHNSDGFWPWHREFLSRYEALLREAYPTVTLFYWDWTHDPRTWPVAVEDAVIAASPNGIGGFGGPIASAFTIGADVSAALSPMAPLPFYAPALFPYNGDVVSRFTGATSAPESTSDVTITAQLTYSDARSWDEGYAPFPPDQAHNFSHPFIGGQNLGNMFSLPWAAQDPFFFLLHANVDKLWSEWQRTRAIRYDPSNTGGNALAYAGSMNYMYQAMAPWNGLTYNGTTPMPPGNPEIVVSLLPPWTQTPGDETAFKTANDDSVIFPPVYDVAPLTIPVLQAGQSVVVEIPWYPPKPSNYSCFGPDSGHVCLLARITTSSTPPYGMDFAETSDLYSNVKNNSTIAWRNETVLDGGISPPGPLINDAVLVRNLSGAGQVQLGLTLPPVGGKSLADFGSVLLDLGPVLYGRWMAAGSYGSGFIPAGGTALQLTGTTGFVGNLTMASNEVQRVEVDLVLSNAYPNPQGLTYTASLTQSAGTVGQNETVGGQLFAFNFNQIDIVPKHATWRYWDIGQFPGSAWNQLAFADSPWPSGAAKLGYGIGDEATVLASGPVDESYITTWFRYDFAVNQPSFFTNLWLQLEAYDGAVVYLNGVEIARQGMPGGPISPATPALAPVTGLAAETYYPYNVSSFLPLLESTNVLAVEVHTAETNNSAELGLDLELSGNVFAPRFPPQSAPLALALNPPPNNGLYLFGAPIVLGAATVATANPVKSVSYYGDSTLLGTVAAPPYTFLWSNAPPGIHQVTVQATDTVGLSGVSFSTLEVLRDLPPTIYLTSPSVGQVFAAGQPITITAGASEAGGVVQRVDFYYLEHGVTINASPVLAGTATTVPYTVTLPGLAPGTYLLSAIATDQLDVRSYAVPVHVCVLPVPTLSISNVPPYLLLAWSPTNAVLQQAASVIGPWLSLTNVTSPYGFLPNRQVPSAFFRVTLSVSDALCAP